MIRFPEMFCITNEEIEIGKKNPARKNRIFFYLSIEPKTFWAKAFRASLSAIPFFTLA